MPLTRSRKSLGDESIPTTTKKILKLSNRAMGVKLRAMGVKLNEGTVVLLRRSVRLKCKCVLSGRGTDLEFVRLLHACHFFGPGYGFD
ncbi:hypothetical protein PHJA_001857100 [Phtheirospermum japonicum]|uniref:Uncharacterized protein n=1 Tax=Phtheirospermum japonicum TaxID=374723 RepID=A0A830CBY3_9LAMI|nr:hypothetical protein PHJA_001857100 [Phtheirospermum japonicum]